jgi:hypothetical protein
MKIEITKDQLERLREIINFYGEGNNFEWEGCSCHGRYQPAEHGEQAEEALTLLNSLEDSAIAQCEICKTQKINSEKCPECGWEL